MSEQIKFTPQPKQEQFLRSTADITIFGGAAGGGKTWSLLYEPLYHIKNGAFGAIIFRRTYPQITLEGGLWDESESIYPYAGAVPTKGALRWTFPSDSTVVFRSMENEQDRYNFDGSQIPLIGFDQLESFTEKQFFYMLSRNRSTCGVRPYIRGSCNPQPGWLAQFIQWWWDEQTGYAIPERSGKVRWFVRIGDGLRWYDSLTAAKKKHPESQPKSVTFILSKLDDNQVLMKKDPGYLANLMALPLVDRERLLGGNWKIAVAGNIFKREWWKFVDAPPAGIYNWCRYWDLAATVPKEGQDPDWTAGAKLGELNGDIYIADVVHFQGSSLTNERTIKATAELDGPAVAVRMEQEGGASGKSLSGDEGHYARNILVGYDFSGVPSSKKKLLRWAPLSAAAEKGRVYLVKGRWNQDFVDELEGCRGEDEKNDQCLVAGTMITCRDGQTAIEFVRAGDEVLTRQGWCNVEWAGQTGVADELIEVESENGCRLTSTKNHLYFTKQRGFICLDAATGALDLICLRNTNLSGPRKTELNTNEVSGSCEKEFVVANGQNGQRGIRQASRSFTETFGRLITGRRFQRDFSSITRMAITKITQLRIWIAFRIKSTPGFTKSVETLTPKTHGVLQGAKEEGLEQPNGTVVRTGLSGIGNTERNLASQIESRLNLIASTAGRNSKPQPSTQSVVLANAPVKDSEVFRKTERLWFVPNAEQRSHVSKRTHEDQGQSIAARLVGVKCFSVKAQPVYNLKVRDVPEFFANGILVHNCDAASGALEALRVPTGAWDAQAIAVASTGYQRPLGTPGNIDATTYDPMQETLDATE